MANPRYACRTCGIWTCSACGWKRGYASLNYQEHYCGRCPSREGTLLPTMHIERMWRRHNDESPSFDAQLPDPYPYGERPPENPAPFGHHVASTVPEFYRGVRVPPTGSVLTHGRPVVEARRGRRLEARPTKGHTVTKRITLPTPVLTADFVQRHEGTEGVAPLLRNLGEAIARQIVLESLATIRSRHQGVKLTTEMDAAGEACADAEEALDNHIAEWSDLSKIAHEIRARDVAIEVLAGMVARLMAEQN